MDLETQRFLNALLLGEKKLNLGESCVLKSYEALLMRLTNSCELWRWSGLWLMLGGGKGKETMRAAWGISCLCLKSPGRQGPMSREPSQDFPGEAGSPSPHSPCTSRKSYTQKQAPLLICAFEVWAHPQPVSQRHIKQVATPTDQVRPPLRERSRLGNQSQFTR